MHRPADNASRGFSGKLDKIFRRRYILGGMGKGGTRLTPGYIYTGFSNKTSRISTRKGK